MKRIVWLTMVSMLLWCAAVQGQRQAASLFESDREMAAETSIDRAVLAQLKKLDIEPARLCSDAVFVRRVHLDVVGALPTADQARAFLDDTSPDKRAKLIDQLLDDPRFADYQAMRWCDLLRVKAEFPINLWPNAAAVYHRYLHDSIRLNKRYDKLARELLTSSGSNFRVAPVNFYRALQGKSPEALAQVATQTFMGVRIEAWPKDKREGVAGFFTYVGFKPTREWKEEIVYFDLVNAATDHADGKMPHAVLPEGTRVSLSPETDPRTQFADWLIDKDNPYFARCMANRAWSWLMGRGIIHEPDDIRDDNPPVNPRLLEALEHELVQSGWDLKHLYRVILNSQTYQLSPVPHGKHPDAAANFAHYRIRRLEAEVLIDALCSITGTTEEYSSQIPEPFTFVPPRHRTVTLPDGSITSPFLEMFGKPPRDTGMADERNNKMTAAQALHLLNSSHVRQKLERGPGLRAVFKGARRNPQKAVETMYLSILSRKPTVDELKRIGQHARQDRRRGAENLVDTAWALVNSTEFLYRH